MAPTAVRMVLVEGENGDGALVDQEEFNVAADPDAATVDAADQVIAAILGTREGAAEGGYQLASTGVTWRDPNQAAALRDALAHRKIENVMLVSAFLAAAALAQSVGSETNYAQTALLFIEPETATLAVVNSADGSIAEVSRQPLVEDDEAAVAQLAELVSGAEALETRPDAVFLVGSGVDIPLIKPALEAATTLPLTAPEEPETALARGAALASAHTPLLVSSTAARAYAQDPGTGAYTVDPALFENVDSGLAYSAVDSEPDREDRKPFALLGSVLASIFVIGVASLVVSLAVSIRTTSGTRPEPGQAIVVPTQQVPEAPAPTPQAPAPVPEQVPTPQAPAPQVPEQVPTQVPQAPAPAPQAPAPAPQAPVEVPAAPAPAPAAPIPVPIPVPILTPQLPLNPGGGGKPPGIGKIPGPKLPGGGKGPGRGGGKGGGGRGGFNIPFVPGI
ncbi:hypothetical protein A5634_01655 [Mycobacterium asiaticum]|uniref:DUF7159 domain-containing protein n=1 Tax=Mycobacterium asiaticum TaxID=1790 RepID=A0A1A3NYN8_MYCAS|nr:hypothetical protein [Mycobacterium asiaticum]OBK27128.1 hypothetical protein A5634_01655 [Mycobacterium asiaticum]